VPEVCTDKGHSRIRPQNSARYFNQLALNKIHVAPQKNTAPYWRTMDEHYWHQSGAEIRPYTGKESESRTKKQRASSGPAIAVSTETQAG